MLSKVDVKGGGVSGPAAAWHLQQSSAGARASARNDVDPNPTKIDVQLFEAEDRLGGHAQMIQVGNQTKTLTLI